MRSAYGTLRRWRRCEVLRELRARRRRARSRSSQLDIETATGVVPLSDDAWTGIAPRAGRDRGLLVDRGDQRIRGSRRVRAPRAPPRTASGRSSSPCAPARPTRAPRSLAAAVDAGRARKAAATSTLLGPRRSRRRRRDSLAGAGFDPERELQQMRVRAAAARSRPAGPTASPSAPSCPGRDEAAWVDGEQPRLRRARRAGRLDGRHAARSARPSRGSTPRASCSRSTPTVSPGSAGPRCTRRNRRREPVALGEIYVIGADPPGTARASGARSPPAAWRRSPTVGSPSACCSSTPPTRPRRACTARSASPCTASTARTGATVRRDVMTSRYGATRAEVDALLAELGRTALPRRAGVGRAVPPAAAARRRHRAAARRCASASAIALPLALEPLAESTAHDGMTTKWLWGCTRDGAQIETVLMRYPDPRDGVRVVAGRVRDGLHVLRHRPGGVRAAPRSRRDRRAGPARRRTRHPSVSATSCSWAWASRSRTTTTRGPRSSACTPTSGSRPAGSP